MGGLRGSRGKSTALPGGISATEFDPVEHLDKAALAGSRVLRRKVSGRAGAA